jgi:hypothetical protein
MWVLDSAPADQNDLIARCSETAGYRSADTP